MSVESYFEAQLKSGISHLVNHDKTIAELIVRYSPPTFRPHNNYFQSLVNSIISQQLNTHVATIIKQRLVERFGHFPTPKEVIACDFETLRGLGLSARKIQYITDLATCIKKDSISFKNIDKLSNQQIIGELTKIKGIGEWTAQMFLLFCMGRLDILAYGDLGIRKAITKLYGLNSPISADDIKQVAKDNNWHPYESIACWYAWRSLENKPTTLNHSSVV